MKLKRGLRNAAVGLLLFLFCNNSVHANVYATDIRMNGSLNAGVTVPGAPVAISYILNDDADAGVSLRIMAGTNVIDTFTIPGGSRGSHVGLNSILWGGTNESGLRVEPEIYTVSISAASLGYDDWTTLTDDSTNFFVPGPRGIDVNRNTNSPYYGRVFVGCTVPADAQWLGLLADAQGFGIQKSNADGSPAEEGDFSNGGLSWGAGTAQFAYYSPWKIAVAANDKVYINDFSGFGFVYAFDETISTNYQSALTTANYPYQIPNPPFLSGLYTTGSGTNCEIWMSDTFPGTSVGIVRWQLLADGTVSTNDTGTTIIPVTNISPMSVSSYDLAIDSNGFIYTIQQISTNDFGVPALMCFPPYEGFPETNAVWSTGAGDPALQYDYGIAVNPSATLVAVAVRGDGDPESGMTGMLNLYNARNGLFVTNLDQTGGDQYTDVAWDNVGNLYALDTFSNVWRVYSPPGANQAATAAVPFIQVYDALTSPQLQNPSLSDAGLNFTLTGQSNVTYYVQQSPDMVTWTAVATNYSTRAIRPLTIPCADNQDFYRAVVGR